MSISSLGSRSWENSIQGGRGARAVRFLIDAHHIGTRATGNETWAIEVATAAANAIEQSGNQEQLLFAVSNSGTGVLGGSHDAVPLSGGAVRRLLWDLPRAARHQRVDAVLVQYTAPLSRTPSVVAIHDLSFTDPRSRQWIPPRELVRMRATIRWSANRADRIVALSEYTAEDLQRQWNIDPARIVVAYPAVGANRATLLRKRPHLDRDPTDRPMTVLAVGNVLPRKNLLVLAAAVRMLRERGIDAVLRIAGQVPAAGSAVFNELGRIGGEWLTVSGYVSEAQLVAAYHEADVFCFPSLYEGFGLPVLEAMTAGVPTLVSDATALPEAAGDAGLLVDPHEPAAWADTLELVLTDHELADRMRVAGFVQAARFSWDDTAARVLGALRAVAS